MGIKTLLRKLIKRTALSSDRESSSTLVVRCSSSATCSISSELEILTADIGSTASNSEVAFEQTASKLDGCGALHNALSTLAFMKKLPLHELSVIGHELDFSAFEAEYIEFERRSPSLASISDSIQPLSATPLLEAQSYDSLPSPISSQFRYSSSTTTSYVSAYERTPPTSPLLINSSPQWKHINDNDNDTSSVVSHDIDIIPLLLPDLTVISLSSTRPSSPSSEQSILDSDIDDETLAPYTSELTSLGACADFIAFVHTPYLQSIANSAIASNNPSSRALLLELDREIDCECEDTLHTHCGCELRSLGTHRFRTRGITELEKRIIKRGAHILYLQSLASSSHNTIAKNADDLANEDLEIIAHQLFPVSPLEPVLSDSTFRAFLAKLVYWDAIDHQLRNRLINLQPCFDHTLQDEEGVEWCPKTAYLNAGPPPVRVVDGEKGDRRWRIRSESDFWDLVEYEGTPEGGGQGEQYSPIMTETRLRSFESDPDIF